MPDLMPESRTRCETTPSPLGPSRFSTLNRRRLSAPALRTFLAISQLWALTEDQRRLILGSPPRSTYHKWVKTAREHGELTLDVDVLTRISAVLGIHKALGILNETEQEAISWLRGPHHGLVFGGNPPLDLLTSGAMDSILTVRRFLDAARGGLYMPPNDIDLDFQPYTDADIALS